MPEIKRKPIERDGMVCFDEDHTHADIVRYMMADGMTKEELVVICEGESNGNAA